MVEEAIGKISLESLDKKFDALHADFSTISSRIDIIDKKVDRVDEAQRKNGVLLERIEGKFSLLYEGYLTHDARLVGLEERTDKIEKRIDEGFTEMDCKFKIVFGKLEKIGSTLSSILAKLDRKIDREEFSAFQKRILPGRAVA